MSNSSTQVIDLEPFLQRERAAEEGRVAAAQERAVKNRHSLRPAYPEASFAPRSEADIFGRAAENAQKAKAFAESPRGRFINACRGLEAAGYEHTADRAMGFYRRGFQMGADKASMQGALGELLSVDALDLVAATASAAGCFALIELMFTPQDAA